MSTPDRTRGRGRARGRGRGRGRGQQRSGGPGPERPGRPDSSASDQRVPGGLTHRQPEGASLQATSLTPTQTGTQRKPPRKTEGHRDKSKSGLPPEAARFETPEERGSVQPQAVGGHNGRQSKAQRSQEREVTSGPQGTQRGGAGVAATVQPTPVVPPTRTAHTPTVQGTQQGRAGATVTVQPTPLGPQSRTAHTPTVQGTQQGGAGATATVQPTPLGPQSRTAHTPTVQGTQRGGAGATATVQPTPVVPPTRTAHTPTVIPGHDEPRREHHSWQPPPRPDFGRVGRNIQLRANFFPVKFPKCKIYHYDVTITPGKCPRSINRRVIEAIVSKHADYFQRKRPAFDGMKNLYSVVPLPSSPLELDVTLPPEPGERDRAFKVKVQLAAKLDLGLLDQVAGDSAGMSMVQALDVVMRHLPSMRYVSIGRSFFTPPQGQPIQLGDGKVVWQGYHQSLRPIMKWKIALNLDVSATAMYEEQPVIEFLSGLLRPEALTRPLRDFDRVRFAKEIKGLKVEVTHLPYPRKYKVCDVTRMSASEQTFPLNDEPCTVQKYFRDVHKRELKYPRLPCLHVGQKSRHVYIPVELCKIVGGQRCPRHKLSEYQTSQMIRNTAKPAPQRERNIRDVVHDAEFDRDPILRDFGISVAKEMVHVSGRVLPAPALQFKDEKTTVPKRGAWEMREMKFYTGVEINRWAIVNFTPPRSCNERELGKFISQLRETSHGMGMPIRSDPTVVYIGDRRQRHSPTVEQTFRKLCTDLEGLQLIIAVLEKKGFGYGYSDIKRAGNHLIGIATQCILAQNVAKAQRATISNLCLKINAKLGGINNIIDPGSRSPWLFQMFKKPVIVMGADVTHPAPGDTRKPSIAAVVGSMDVFASVYRADTRVQRHRQEIIADLLTMVKDMLIAYYRENGKAKPERIIFYRDGVSEGQFQEVIYDEICAIRQACRSLQQDYQPGITFLVVQKRHHTRLFCTNEGDKEGRSGNVPPGTTVDRDITHPTQHDFYLCSHAGIQGTSRPCHYHVLWDDNDFTADDLQLLSYHLCHSFFRCNRSVSYPAPAYYAHHAAYQARCLLQEQEGDAASVSSSSSQSGPPAHMAEDIKINDRIKGRMYFA